MYDNEWSTYEARGSSSGGRSSSQFAASSSASSSSTSLPRKRQGEQVVGLHHHTSNNQNANPYSRGGKQQQQEGNATMTNRYNNNNNNNTSLSHIALHAEIAPSASLAAMGYNSNSSSNSSSRIRVADYRSAAARVGTMPLMNNDDERSFFDSSNPTTFQNANFLKSLNVAPTITVTLPNELRSTLNNEQCQVVESVLSGYSTFFTGPAGSGKSHILSTILRANTEGITTRKKIVVTATTGVAACNVGGITIHSFAGIGVGSGSYEEMAKRVMGNEYTKQRWRECDILIIDEISMLGSSFLDKLNFIACRVRNDRRPFGGVQLVVCGDFYQLPPVELNKDGFAFESKCWSEVIQCSVLLKQVFRQRGDTKLMNILDEARIGELSYRSVEALRQHGTLPAAATDTSSFGTFMNDTEKIIPTLLECRNREVDKANDTELAKLPGEMHTFTSRDKAVSEAMKAQLKHCQAPAQLDLKVGAQVMLLKNIDLEKGLANGSRGVIVRFQRPKSDSEIPTGFKKLDLPVVRFDIVKAVGLEECDNDDGCSVASDINEFTIHPEEWANKMGDQIVSSRVQIPLRLAWSISVHKSQGMTIPNLTVNLAGVFEYGQAYVALSRATELRRLTLRGFSEKTFRAHPKVKTFYSLLAGDSRGGGYVASSGRVATNKENTVLLQRCQSDGTQAVQVNPYTSGSRNPYSQPTMTRNSPVSQMNNYSQTRPNSASLTPPPPSNLTQDQLARMEENRKRAIAIRMKKRNCPSY